MPPTLDAEWLRRRYLDDLVPVADIAAEAGVNPSTVHRNLSAHGIPLRGRADVHRAGEKLTPRWLRAQHRRGETVADMARAAGVSEHAVRDRLAALQLIPPATDPELLHRLYVVEGRTIAEVASEIGISPRNTRTRLLAAGVPLRAPGRRPRP